MKADIVVTDGTDVTVNVTKSNAAGDIIVGDIDNAATNDATLQASGNVVVTATNNTTGATANADLDATMSDIYVDGGSTITVTQATSATDAATNTTGGTVNQGDVLITAGANTTTVSVSQTATVAEAPYVAAIAAVASTSTVTFGLMAAAGDSVTVNGLTFTAAKALTANEVAAAFASLTSGDLQANGGVVANGIFTGSNTASFTTSAVNGATVTYSSPTTATPVVGATGTAVAPTATAGTTAVGVGPVTEGVLGVNTGKVTILDTATTATIKTVTVDGYKTGSTIGVDGAGATQQADALTTLSLANSNTGASFAVATEVTSLDLTVNNVNGSLTLDHDGNVTANNDADVATLNVTTATAASTIALQADAVTNLTVAGTQLLTLTSSSLNTLKTVVVTGTAGLTIGGTNEVDTVTSVNTSGTSGTTTIAINSTAASYTGGAGNDNVTFSNNTNATKAINLGAGNNTLTLATGTTGSTSELIAGAGTRDTLVMAAADADSVSGSTTFETKITGFERLSLEQVATTANNTINLANMDDISYVISAGTFDTAYVVSSTIVGSTDNAADTVTIVVDGVTYTSAAAIYANGAAITTALVTAINAGTGTVTATDIAGVLTLTSDIAGRVFTVGAITGVTGGGAADTVTKTDVITSSELFLTNMANNGTLELTGAGMGATVTMTDATGVADTFNILIGDNATNVGTVNVNGVENVKVTTTNTSAATLVVSADAAKTVNVSGAGDLTLDTASSVLTKVDASAMTGDLVYTADGATAGTEVIAGSGDDILRASGENDVLKGNVGTDTFYATDLTTVYGGAGADKFYFATPTQLSKVSTIADLGSGDTIYLQDAGVAVDKFFAAGANINPNTTTTFEAKVNASLVQTGAGEATWFQHSGNTYIVIDGDDIVNGNPAAGAVDTYTAGKDTVIEIIGTKDLSTASFNVAGTLEIA